ncbi:TPA: hypothetical protein L4623_004926 [Pseudomonas aeruginosa]|uniref:phospholipase D-like domain-containing protein n=1 Tax=Pseudomonas aeruginosa TaxID=287 RepID=UPI000F817958|nr:phospholipase D-like domain-containing protein [Pseudomonas aeruginosa]EIU5250294.1 hypothetical protein [Pseudomonas aeruginosa]MBG6347764.1 hypothetical protein [Pseudomonas aeruginosa]MBG6545791.1 hypothetical protein [Pseudomonas aeruginosa]MBH4419480.1 hypothetical protein [Pseudomonas aeruginosa]MBH8651367.1 hypothetical protein [Pseudomonas aeruginosa]
MHRNSTSIKNTSHFEDIKFHLKNELRKAKSSIKICVAWISWSDYTPVFNELSRKGVHIEILYNDDFINRKNFVSPDSDVELYPIKGRFYKSIMHNKFCIIDSKTVVTGSFNWSHRASSHFENIVFIENDFRLAKSFLHEFEDLKNYFSEFYRQDKLLCASAGYTDCLSASYNLGILGAESGLYDESLVDIWNVCFKSGHMTFLGEQYEHHLHLNLGLKDLPDWDDFESFYDMETMLAEFRHEREQIHKIQNYFNHNQGNKIHAVGVIAMDNPNEHIEWGEEPEYVIKTLWRDMYYRKLIPDVIYDGYLDIECIVRRHE